MNTVVTARPASAAHSRFVQRVRRRYAAERAAWPDTGMPDAPAIDALVASLCDGGRDLGAALRVARQLVLERLAVHDVERGAPLAAVTAAMTALAEIALDRALAAAERDADARFGAPLRADGSRVALWIVGMGKLGARELNVSSDIDLVYVYEEGGQSAGGPAVDGARAPQPVSLHEYFAFVVRRLYALVGETTDDGFVFRVDLALRPNGNAGPPVVSLAMLEEYLQVQGREWERLAWLKSRIVAPRAAAADPRALALRALVTPFVYRRYLDYGVFEALRQLHRKIRDEAQRRAAGRPERANDVKLSRGGIREIEFVVQLMLVVRGGQFPEIRTRSTLRGLQRLVASGLMKADTAAQLADGYTFLRRVEHRIQYLDDQQTHLLPGDDADLAWVAAGLDAAAPASASELMLRLGEVRELVAGEFDALLRDGGPAGAAPGVCRGSHCVPATLPVDSEALLEGLPVALAAHLTPWVRHTRVQALREDSRLRLGRLMQRTGRWLDEGLCDDAAALRFVDWVQPLLRRENYLALLVERPEVHRRLLRLFGLARWPTRYLMRHPGVVDELAGRRLLDGRFDRAAFADELGQRAAAWRRGGEDDEERLLDALRHAHHAEVFRTLVRDVEGRLTVEQVADDLSALADAVLECAVRWVWPRLKQRHRDAPALAVVAYGKLGGRELGYGSDLDLVFLYDDDGADEDRGDDRHGPDASNASDGDSTAEGGGGGADAAARLQGQDVYGAFVRKLIPWLTLRTGAGELFDIDTALRPNGNAGLLVTGMRTFERYQVGRGGHTAWTWEHQALTRARVVTGTSALAARFERARRAVLTTARDPAALRAEVQAMRAKVRAAHAVPGARFDVKHSPGGMIDVEFAVQLLVLLHSAAHPALQDNVGNIALLQRAEDAGLLPPTVGHAAADAYRELRRAQHRARLDERPTQFDPTLLAVPRDAVLALWHAVFG